MIKKNYQIFFLLFSISLLGYLIKIGANIFLARHISVSTYGDFNLALKVLMVFVTLSMFGSNFGANRYLSKFINKKQFDSAAEYIAWNTKLLSITFLISFIVILFAFTFMMILHSYEIRHINEYHLVVYTLWLFPFATVGAVIYSYLESANQIIMSAIFKKCLKYTIQLLLLILIVLFIDPLLHNISLIFTLFAVYTITATLSLFFMNKTLSSVFFPSIFKFNRHKLSEKKGAWIKTSTQLTINSLSLTFVYVADLMIIELISHSEEAVGYYAAGLMIAEILWTISNGMFRQTKPQISTLLETKKSRAQLQKHLNVSNRAIWGCLSIVALLIILFAKYILLLFGPNYGQAIDVVIILTIATVIYCLANNASIILILGGHEKLCSYLTIIELFSTIIFMVTLTYIYGIIGTAISTACIALIKLSLHAYFCRTKLGLRYLIIF